VAHSKHGRKVHRGEGFPRKKAGFVAPFCKTIPRADILAVVASEDSATYSWPELSRDETSQFNGEIRNAKTTVHDMGSNDGVGRTGRDAPVAGAAVVPFATVWGKLDRYQDLAEKKPRAPLPGNEIRMFPEPSKTGCGRVALFQKRTRIDVGSRFASTPLSNLSCQLAELFLYYSMVILAARVGGDDAFFRANRFQRALVIVQSAADHCL
jgi:hypothetical protein